MSLGSQRENSGLKTLVVGSDPSAALAARQLPGEVQLLSLTEELVHRVDGDVGRTRVVEDPQRFEGVDDDVDAAVVATPADSKNLLYAQCLRVDHGVSDIVVRLNDPHNRDVLSGLDVEPVCVSTGVSESLVERYARIVA